MPTPSGTIGLSDVNAELGFSPTALITMNDAAVRTLAGVPSGVISMQNLQNKSNRVSVALTISGNTNNYDVYTNRGPTYSAGTTDITLTINPGIFVSSTSTGTSALLVPSAFNPGDTVKIVNNGTIVGRGGNGGTGAANAPFPPGTAGGSGGPALFVQFPTTVENNNRVAGGGGGGGGGGSGFLPAPTPDAPSRSAGGGGGGGGIGSGSGGAGGSAGSAPNVPGSSGTAGTLTAAGSGGPSSKGAGGAGGGYGSAGSNGAFGDPSGRPPTAGGASGAAVTGNTYITWSPTGTRNGPIS